MDQILVVEDEKPIRNAIKSTLENSGYKVTIARNGKEGLEYFNTLQNFKLVITDIKMPIMDGIKLAKSIRNSGRPDTPIIGISAFLETIKIEDGLFNLTICKPFELKYLKKIVSQHLES